MTTGAYSDAIKAF